MNGIILLPDEWDSSIYELDYTNNENAAYSSNQISVNDWSNILEINGAIFLPAAGRRFANANHGFYWSSTHYNYQSAYLVHFHDEFYFDPDSYTYRMEGLSVRLVQDY